MARRKASVRDVERLGEFFRELADAHGTATPDDDHWDEQADRKEEGNADKIDRHQELNDKPHAYGACDPEKRKTPCVVLEARLNVILPQSLHQRKGAPVAVDAALLQHCAVGLTVVLAALDHAQAVVYRLVAFGCPKVAAH